MVFLQFIGGIMTSGALLLGVILIILIFGVFFEDLHVVLEYTGFMQFAYLIPLAIMFNKQKQPGLAAGVLVGGGLLFLLLSACFGYFD